MTSPELLLLGGKPYAGKSTIAREFEKVSEIPLTSHFSIGDRLRDIHAGRTSSAHGKAVMLGVESLARHAALPYDLVNNVFEEFCSEEPSGLVIVDNYPAYHETFLGFKKTIERVGATVVAFCHVEVPDKVVYNRIVQRAQRWKGVEEDTSFVERRLADYQQLVAPTLKELASVYPSYVLDGTDSVETNVARLQKIYMAEISSSSH